MDEIETTPFLGIRVPPVRQGRDSRLDIQHRPGYVYLVSGGDYYKIGRTKNIPARMTSFGLHLPFATSLMHTIPCYDYIWAERALHNIFGLYRVNGEWFKLDTPGWFTFTMFARQIETGWKMAWNLSEEEQATHCDPEWWSIFRSWFNGTQADD